MWEVALSCLKGTFSGPLWYLVGLKCSVFENNRLSVLFCWRQNMDLATCWCVYHSWQLFTRYVSKALGVVFVFLSPKLDCSVCPYFKKLRREFLLISDLSLYVVVKILLPYTTDKRPVFKCSFEFLCLRMSEVKTKTAHFAFSVLSLS